MASDEAGLPVARPIGEHAHWEVHLRHCADSGRMILSAYMDTMGYSGSGRVFEAELPDGVAADTLTARDALLLIAAADRVAVGGSHFGHAPRWIETDLHRITLENSGALR